MSDTERIETDSIGDVAIDSDRLWGAQSQRSLANFAIGNDKFPAHFIHDFARVKLAAAKANQQLDNLDEERTSLIVAACEKIIAGQHDDQFPLSVWQTGSGTQTNMNLNEVIANIGNRIKGNVPGTYEPLHPNDHVNRSQSSNDIFPTVMHVVVHRMVSEKLTPGLINLTEALAEKENEFKRTVKSGRTHMMDATPVTLGQEFGAFRAQITSAQQQIEGSLDAVKELAIGGTAVGSGLNSPQDWSETVVNHINRLTGRDFRPAKNKFAQLAAHDAILALHSALNGLATAVYKLASDLRLMNSGPRCGLSEIRLPSNEPGSSIMPGKVNPTQVEAITMVCLRVMGNNGAISMANSQGQFQLNVYKPLMVHLAMESIDLLADAIASFTHFGLDGIEANEKRLTYYTSHSLMLVTALSPHIGYKNAARIAKHALENQKSLREAAIELDLMSGEEFDKRVRPEDMLGHQP